MPDSTFAVKRQNFEFEFAQLSPAVFSELRSALVSGSYILSEEVERFERAFAAYVGVDHALGVNSGTDALVLALQSIDVGAGDEVITVANTFHATALAIARTGAKPVLVDARPEDFQMDVGAVRAAITSRTKAVLPVHLFGLPLDLTPVARICREYGLRLIEDCAQATGARVGGRSVGTFGDISCFSFHPSKNLAAAGDGGAVCTSNSSLADRIRGLRYFGQRDRKIHSELGHNSKLDALQAIVLYHKLPLLETWNELRRVQARRYISELRDLPLGFQAPAEDNTHVYHLFQVRTSRRDALLSHLVERQIDAVVRYPRPIHLQDAFSYLGHTIGAFPVAETLAKETLALPMRPDMSGRDTELVVGAVRGFFRSSGGSL